MSSSRSAFFVISLIGLFFGYWFASQQVGVVATDAMQTYPWLYFTLTMVKCYLTVIIFFLFSALFLNYLSKHKTPLLFIACSFLPLGVASIIKPFYWVMSATIIIQILLLVSVLRIDDYRRIFNKFLFDFFILLGFIALHTFYTTRFSPTHWNAVLFTANGATSQEAYMLAPIYQGFLLAKQFAFDYVDHAQWAGIMNTPVSLISPFMQLITFNFDLPSLSVNAFHQIIALIAFTLIIVGSFGCYLFLRYAAKLHVAFAIYGGTLYFLSGDPHIERMFTLDAGIFLSSYAVFPYALLFITLAFRYNSLLYALWASVALASQFFFIYPHPEAVIYSFFFFGLYTVGLYRFDISLPVAHRRKLMIYSMSMLLALSAFIFSPIVYDRLTENMYVFAHTGDISSASSDDFIRYFLLLFFAIVIHFSFLNRTTISAVFKASLFLASCILLLALISMNATVIKIIAKKVHIGLHVWFTWRYGMYFCFMTFVVLLFVLDNMTKALVNTIEKWKTA